VTFALDSWAVLRLLEGDDPAAGRVQDVLDGERPVMSWINLGEVFYVVRREEGDAEAQEVVRDIRSSLILDLPPEARVLAAATLKAEHAMAYADAFAAATALAYDATLITGDPELLLDGSPWRWEDLRTGAPGG
jgi:predicted nucleic acid-binding protein